MPNSHLRRQRDSLNSIDADTTQIVDPSQVGVVNVKKAYKPRSL